METSRSMISPQDLLDSGSQCREGNHRSTNGTQGEESPPSAKSEAQSSTCDGSIVRTENKASGSAALRRHSIARAITATLSRAGGLSSKNATASSFEPMRPVTQL